MSDKPIKVEETWQHKFLTNGSDLTGHDLSILIQTVCEIREEAKDQDRSRIEIELMSVEKHSHPGEPGLFVAWHDIKKVLTPTLKDSWFPID